MGAVEGRPRPRPPRQTEVVKRSLPAGPFLKTANEKVSLTARTRKAFVGKETVEVLPSTGSLCRVQVVGRPLLPPGQSPKSLPPRRRNLPHRLDEAGFRQRSVAVSPRLRPLRKDEVLPRPASPPRRQSLRAPLPSRRVLYSIPQYDETSRIARTREASFRRTQRLRGRGVLAGDASEEQAVDDRHRPEAHHAVHAPADFARGV